MAIFTYTPHIIPGINGTKLRFKPSRDMIYSELATIDGITYIHIPENTPIPTQPKEIKWSQIDLTPELKSSIKASSHIVKLISENMNKKIREKYSVDDELYFARISSNSANGVHKMSESELYEITTFNQFIESVRQWGRAERAKIGL